MKQKIEVGTHYNEVHSSGYWSVYDCLNKDGDILCRLHVREGLRPPKKIELEVKKDCITVL